MKTSLQCLVFTTTVAVVLFLSQCSHPIKWKEIKGESYNLVTNEGGPALGFSSHSGITILSKQGFGFKDLNRNGKLDKYEDWRLPVEERAKDLASKMSVEQIAGLMLYSGHQSIPAGGRGPFGGTYGGKPFRESGAAPSDLSDEQKKFLTEDNLRHMLITRVQNPEVAARWNNNAQALVEGIGFGIPVNNSSDPRHGTRSDMEYNLGAGGEISMWPSSLGMAATFDPGLVRNFGDIASKEYRALGIATALSPQVDIATDPRWMRFSGTFGPDPQLSADMGRAYTDGFQTSAGEMEISGGWGYTSVNAMVKHWPGGGSGEGGRDAHYGYGKFAVYPGENIQDHLIPFIQGAFDLQEGTGMASTVMPYYTISYGQDPGGENVGNAYSKYFINDLLRTKYGYKGVVCTDWNVTHDVAAIDVFTTGKSWGVRDLSEVERHYRLLKVGVDQFGGNNESKPVLEAYQMGVEEIGEDKMRARFEASAVRLLINIFQTGLFENPYLDPEKSKQEVGKPEYMTAGFEAQLKSIVMLKNKNNVLPREKNSTVYIPKRYHPSTRSFFGTASEARWDYPVNLDIVRKFFNVTENPPEADFALVFIESPNSGGGYQIEEAKSGDGNGYFPISLQYRPYIAKLARDPSIAGGDPLEVIENRSYKGKTVTTTNEKDLDIILETKRKLGQRPVIVCINVSNPAIVDEFEKSIDGLLMHFDVQNQALLEVISGGTEPTGLLPLQMPANMETVETQFEDVPLDMKCHVDTEGNTYDFAFGLNWSGVISDERTDKYRKR